VKRNYTDNQPAMSPVSFREYAAKFWLDPVRLEHSRGFAAVEIRYMERFVREREQPLLRNWYEYFGNRH
jgi:hypothetical protein